jgi:phage terminase small subunit
MMTPKKRLFVAEFLTDLNATAAAQRAGYSARTAKQQGSRLLTDVDVQAAITQAQAQRAERTQIDADWVLKRLAAMADADLSELHNDDGTLRPIKDWPKVWRQGLVAGIEVDESLINGAMSVTTRKVKLADRLKAIELIGRHVTVGAWKEKVEHTGPGGGPVQMVNMTPDEFRAIAAEIAGRV